MVRFIVALTLILAVLSGCTPNWQVGDIVEVNGEAHEVTWVSTDGDYETRRVD